MSIALNLYRMNSILLMEARIFAVLSKPEESLIFLMLRHLLTAANLYQSLNTGNSTSGRLLCRRHISINGTP